MIEILFYILNIYIINIFKLNNYIVHHWYYVFYKYIKQVLMLSLFFMMYNIDLNIELHILLFKTYSVIHYKHLIILQNYNVASFWYI